MSDSSNFPAPVVAEAPPKDKWEREHLAFLRLLPQLLQTHAGKYVAVHDEQVVDSGDDKVALALRVYDRFGYQPIHVGLVSERPEVVRIPYRRPLYGRGS
jgi:hypothetical protein